ncbi:sigma-70 family RNA polymerase sigma factor [Chthonobacter rhizosphaerae]|uniref:sigma-70 family RNA polymerase sigma factor n=1 Tax=Chthonobacter rhizosphaerae TaxID=2735553 RepID=UPI001FE5A606|nr:sigma-70 family RNA polymerase sigma factor [Chthonobacter rhizosphaerae]
MTEQMWDAKSEIAALIPALRAFARTLVRNPTDADDLVQETLMKGIANSHRFQPGTSLKSWLFTILRNTFYTNIKISNREHPGAAGCVSEDCMLLPSQEWSVRGLELREALDRLPEDQREVLVMIGVLGISYEEAAVICGCAVGTIKSRLNRARNRMLSYLEAETPTELLEDNEPARGLAA